MVQIVMENNEFTFINNIPSRAWQSSIRNKIGITKINPTNILGID